MSKDKIKVKDICLMALFTALLVGLEEAMVFLPNIQLTVFLIILYAKFFGFYKSSIMVCVYLLIDALIMGAINPIYTSFQLVGWLLIPILMNTIFKRVDNNVALAFIAILFALLYSWIMIIPSCIIMKMNFLEYLMADTVFELLLALSSFLSTLLLYDPMKKLLNRLFNNEKEDEV